MAQVKYGSGITGLKGSLGGHVFQGGNGGAIVRQKMGKVMPKSAAFMYYQDLFRQVAGAWNNLSLEQKTAWNLAAPTWPHTNRFGDDIQVSGYNVFIELNTLALLAGQDIYVTAFDYPPVQPNSFSIGTVLYDSHIINISYQAWIGPYQKLLLFISDPNPAQSARVPKKYYYAGYTTFDGVHQPNVWSTLVNSQHFKQDKNYSFYILPIVLSSNYNSWFKYSPFKVIDSTL